MSVHRDLRDLGWLIIGVGLLTACAAMPPERAARRALLEQAATDCQRRFPVVTKVEVDHFDQVIAWLWEDTPQTALEPFWECVRDRTQQPQLEIPSTPQPPAAAASAKAFRGEEAQWKSLHSDANREWLLDVGRVASQGALLRFYTLNFEGRLAYELMEVITYWELNCSTGHATRLERAKYALNGREVSRERPGSEEVPSGLAKAFESLCP